MILRRSVDRVELNGWDLDVTVDGETLCANQFTIEVMARSIHCVLPACCELLTSGAS
jgi:hypothetical protein